MARYLISFDDGAMNFPKENWKSAGEAFTRSSESRRRLGYRSSAAG